MEALEPTCRSRTVAATFGPGSQLLASDEVEDMAALYLSHRRNMGAARAVSQHEEAEYILEGFVMQLQWLEDRICHDEKGAC